MEARAEVGAPPDGVSRAGPDRNLAMELVRTTEGGVESVRVVMQVPALPNYVEQMMLDRLKRKHGGTIAAVLLALGMSKVSRAINTAFVERENGTDRHRNARKARKTYRFSKDWRYHEAVTYLSLYSYNFCWPVRTLAMKDADGRPVRLIQHYGQINVLLNARRKPEERPARRIGFQLSELVEKTNPK